MNQTPPIVVKVTEQSRVDPARRAALLQLLRRVLDKHRNPEEVP